LPYNHIVDDREFLLELYRMYEHIHLSKEDITNKYEHLYLDPSKFRPDLNEGDYNSYSAYYTEDQLNELHKTTKNNMSLINVNIRSLNKNCDSLKEFLHCCDKDFEIIGLVETWLKENPQDYFKLDGYNLECSIR
jgi:hypothetical protein